ncbi:MAG: type II toxin-antitoxin system MqsR family toxin [Deltaproteobacteria bacterium]|nr:type II toxin-antitoxin system MqsR family toxin [Deltaproteobacteria bacterium]
MPRWLSRVLDRIHEISQGRRVWFTHKALLEMAELGLDEMDARQVLMELGVEDSSGRVRSEATGEWMYIFKPRIAGALVYMKLILRTECVMVSFHEEAHEGPE